MVSGMHAMDNREIRVPYGKEFKIKELKMNIVVTLVWVFIIIIGSPSIERVIASNDKLDTVNNIFEWGLNNK